MDRNLIGRMTAKFAAADFSAKNAHHDELKEKLTGVEAAIGKAEARRAEIIRALDGYHAPQGDAIAAALLAGKSASEAASSRSSADELRAERDGLTSAIGSLNDQAREIRSTMDSARSNALIDVREDVNAVIASQMAEAREHGERILEIYAGVYAISSGLAFGTLEKNAAAEAVSGITGSGKLLPYRKSIDVHPDIIAMIAALAGKGSAVKVHRVSSAPAP